MNRIRIKWPKGELTAQLADTPTAKAVAAALPAKSRANKSHRSSRPAPWTGFLATTMSALVLVLLPTVVAIYIPLVDFLNRSTAALAK